MSTAGRVTLSHIKDVLKYAFFTKNPQMKLGRWAINKNHRTGLVVDYSNEDHCGTCGEYIEKKRLDNKTTENNDYLYYFELSHMQINTPHK